MDRHAIEQTLRRAYEARVRGDIDEISRIFREDAHFELAGSPAASAVARRTLGVEEFRPRIVELIKTFEMSDLEVLSMVIEGQRAAVHWRVKVRSTITGATATTDLMDLVEFKDGRIAFFLEFCDTALAARLMAH